MTGSSKREILQGPPGLCNSSCILVWDVTQRSMTELFARSSRGMSRVLHDEGLKVAIVAQGSKI